MPKFPNYNNFGPPIDRYRDSFTGRNTAEINRRVKIGTVILRPSYAIDRVKVVREVKGAAKNSWRDLYGSKLYIVKPIHSTSEGDLDPDEQQGIYFWTDEGRLDEKGNVIMEG